MTLPLIENIAPGFEPVRDAFLSNFETRDEIGASFCLMRGDDVLVELYGGYKDKAKTQNWEIDTLVPVYSCTKLVTATVIAHLADMDKLGYDQKVASIWPEFAQNGKENISIGDVLSHQAGLSGITDKSFTAEDWHDREKLAATLAAQEPIFAPGSASGYHPVTFGPLASEIIRRTDGRSLGTILREDITTPLDIDFHIGLSESEFDRCVEMQKPQSLAEFGEMNAATKAAFMSRDAAPAAHPKERWRKAEFGGSNGHGTAKALAQIAHIFIDGNIKDTRFLAEDMLEKVRAPRISGMNLVLPFELTFAAGVMYNGPNYFYGPNSDTLGHSGWGGSCVFADPDEGLTGAYVMNRMSNALLGDMRPRTLIDAAYQCL